jgi:hypothetical protein
MTMKPSAAIFTEYPVRLASTPNCDLDQLAHCRAPLIVLAHHRRPASNNITTDAVGCQPVSRFHNARRYSRAGLSRRADRILPRSGGSTPLPPRSRSGLAAGQRLLRKYLPHRCPQLGAGSLLGGSHRARQLARNHSRGERADRRTYDWTGTGGRLYRAASGNGRLLPRRLHTVARPAPKTAPSNARLRGQHQVVVQRFRTSGNGVRRIGVGA